MRKVLLGFVILLVVPFTAMAQDDTSTDFAKWQIRLRGLVVAPDDSATIEAIGGDSDISTAYIPELDITYFFTENFAAELVLGTAKHDVSVVGTAVGNIDLGSVYLLPPTLMVQYHLTGSDFKPYAGAGINYTFFYNEKSGPVANAVDYDNSVGFALQLGMDYSLNEDWFINVDIKRLFLSTDVTVDATTALGATVGADVTIDPWLAGV
jgi:outer membrane protein